jgi:hypothetical protein
MSSTLEVKETLSQGREGLNLVKQERSEPRELELV